MTKHEQKKLFQGKKFKKFDSENNLRFRANPVDFLDGDRRISHVDRRNLLGIDGIHIRTDQIQSNSIQIIKIPEI